MSLAKMGKIWGSNGKSVLNGKIHYTGNAAWVHARNILWLPVTALLFKTMVYKRCHALAEWEEIHIKYISPKETCRLAMKQD